ncbi:MAG: hypothetical protein ACFE89_09580 [Candidatus Hodarchaeota archaeon]
MDLIRTSRTLAKVGGLLGIVLGIFSAIFWIYIIISRTGFLLWAINLLDATMSVMSVLAILAGYYVYNKASGQISENPFNFGLLLVGLGIIVAIGAWGFAGLLVVISGVLILIEETT